MNKNTISKDESDFLAYLRSLSIFVIVFGHVGGFWVFKPYSEFLHVFVPIFFFISGAVSYVSFERNSSIRLYYKKRIIGLLIPFYLLCLLSLAVFFVKNGHMPNIDIQNIIKWLLVRPSNAIMPFPIGQVWFLNTLFFIIIVSPLYFKLNNNSKVLLTLLMVIFFGMSVVELFYDIKQYFTILDNNLYSPIIYSSFFILGVLYISSLKFIKNEILMVYMLVPLFFSVFLVKLLELNVDYAFHFSPPDGYYMLGGFSAIFFFLLIKKIFVQIVNGISVLKIALDFFHRNTFSIFLIHTFSIYLYEITFDVIYPQEKTIFYGLIKFVTVLFITCFLAKPYSMLSNFIVLKIVPNTGLKSVTR